MAESQQIAGAGKLMPLFLARACLGGMTPPTTVRAMVQNSAQGATATPHTHPKLGQVLPSSCSLVRGILASSRWRSEDGY